MPDPTGQLPQILTPSEATNKVAGRVPVRRLSGDQGPLGSDVAGAVEAGIDDVDLEVDDARGVETRDVDPRERRVRRGD